MKKVLAGLVGGIVGVGAGITISEKVLKGNDAGLEKKVDKFKIYYELLNNWLMLKQNNQSIVKYFENNGYKTIGVYGMGELGNRLCKELSGSEIEIAYAVDKAPETTFSEFDIVEIDEMTENVDVVIVTPVFDFENIKKNIEEHINVPVVSLEDVIFELVC